MNPRTCLIVTKPVFFSRALPDKSFALKGFECKGGETRKGTNYCDGRMQYGR